MLPGDPESGLWTVPQELHGLRATEALQQLLPAIHRRVIRQLLRDGRITVNGHELQAHRKLRMGDLIAFEQGVELDELPKFRPEPVDTPRPSVLYEDGACLVLEKPAGVATVPDRQGQASLHGNFEAWFPGQDLRIVHRLDKGTSGVLVLAKSKEAAVAFDQMFRERQIEKVYAALVRGRPAREEFVCETPIGRTIKGGRVRLGNGKGARESTTHFRVREHFHGFTLLEARPKTGRMHQIRAHLYSMHIPLIVDPLYGGAREFRLSEFKSDYRARRGRVERPLIDRLTLHAASLRFHTPDPVAGGAEVLVEARLPKDLRVVVEKLRRYAGTGAPEVADA